MKRYIILLIIILLSSTLFSEIMLYHDPPISIEPGKGVELNLEIRDGFNEIFNVKLFYRETGTLPFSELDMEKGSETNPVFSVVVEDAVNYRASLNYYFLVIPHSGKNLTLPEIQPEVNPYRVVIEQPVEKSEGFVRLSPDLEFSDISQDYLVAISMFALEDEIDHSSIRFFYDLEDVTYSTQIYSNMLIYEVKKAKQGKHYYYVSANLTDGSKVESEHWFTDVKIKAFELPLNISGKATFNSHLDNTAWEAYEESESDKWANFLLNFKGGHNWLKFKSKLYLSSLETKWAQPVNRYNLGLMVPHFDLIAGDHAPNYGTFQLNSKNIFGFHTNLHFQNFRLLFTSGNSKRVVNGKECDDDDQDYTAGTFKRRTNSLRIEVGNIRSFTLAFGVTKNKDDIKSLNEKYYRKIAGVDSTLTITPKDNIIVGTDFNLSLFKQRFVWGAEAAMSYYNSNIIDGAMSLEEIEEKLDQEIDFPIDPAEFSDLFIVNEFIEPFTPGWSNLAYKTFIRTFFCKNFLNISYTTIGSSLNSLSSNYLQKDARIISINDNINFLNNSLSLSLALNLISDNLYDEKDVTTKTTNYFAQVICRPGEQMYFKLGFNNNNSADDFEPAEDDTTTTSYEINSTNISFGTGYYAENFNLAPTRFSLSFNNSLTKDEANETFDYKKNNIVLSAKSKFEDLPLTTTLSYSLNLNDNETRTYNDSLSQWDPTIQENSNYNAIYLKGELCLLDEKLKPYLDFRYTTFGGDIESQVSQMFNLGTSYNITPDTYISTDLGLKLYQNKDTEGKDDYSKFNWKLKISQKF
ncbi:MAG: hypothetical protein KAW88_09870 [Candidatus Cloacimonetes bacterium]|nr:hypothetical protein [Candidatus Cloacimonadota bacterium]